MDDETVHVLLVEDDADSREVLADLLGGCGYAVRAAGSARQAIELAEAVVPQCALIDLGLPDFDGTVLASKLRREFGSDMVIIALTGRDFGTINAAGDTGIDHVLTKPCDPEQLFALLPPLRTPDV